MDASQLRALQAPIKERYKESPEKAMTPARAEAVIDEDEISSRISTYAGTAVAGLHPATAMRIPLKHAKVIANGTWDARGTLAVDRDAPIGLTEVKLKFEIVSTAERKKLEKMIELTERYCVIYQTLAKPPTLKSEFEVLQQA